MAREKLNRVSVFRTSDGKLIEKREEYLAYERKLKYGKAIEEIVDGGFDARGASVLSTSEVAELILEASDKLRALLVDQSSKTKRRPRKQKVEAVAAAAA